MAKEQGKIPGEEVVVDQIGAEQTAELASDYFEQQDLIDEKQFQDDFNDPINSGIDNAPSFENPEGVKTPEEIAEAAEALALENTPLDFEAASGSSDEDQAELDKMNEILHTDFKSLNELKNSYKKEDISKETKEIDGLRDLTKYHDSLLDYDDEQLFIEDARARGFNDPSIDINDPDWIESIKMKVSELEEGGLLSHVARGLRQEITAAKDKNNTIVNAFDTKNTETKEQLETVRRTKVQESINEIFQEGNFYGVKPTKEMMIKVYKNVNNNKYIDSIKNQPELAVKFGMFLENEKIISANLGKPNFNDGVKKVLTGIGMELPSKQTIIPSKDKGSSQPDLDYVNSLLK